jgi:hypothetical protein
VNESSAQSGSVFQAIRAIDYTAIFVRDMAENAADAPTRRQRLAATRLQGPPSRSIGAPANWCAKASGGSRRPPTSPLDIARCSFATPTEICWRYSRDLAVCNPMWSIYRPWKPQSERSSYHSASCSRCVWWNHFAIAIRSRGQEAPANAMRLHRASPRRPWGHNRPARARPWRRRTAKSRGGPDKVFRYKARQNDAVEQITPALLSQDHAPLRRSSVPRASLG